MIEIKNLSFAYDQKNILKNINLELETGKIHAFFGINGSGKTTFFNCLFGFLKSSGEVNYENRKLLKSDIGFLQTEAFFYKYLNGKEYLNIFNSVDNVQIFDINDLIELFEINTDDFTENYSTGMKKKIAILGIIKLNRDILILDEPFNGLDIEAIYLLKSLLLELQKKGKTILISSHIFEPLVEISNFYHILEKGELNSFNNFEECEAYFKNIAKNIKNKLLKSIMN